MQDERFGRGEPPYDGDPVRSLEQVKFQDAYSSSTDSLLDDFYLPSLTNSLRYDRAAGYFSSSLLALAPLAYADFVERGGRMRLLCSPHLNAQDAEVFRKIGSGQPTEPRDVVTTNLRTLMDASEHESLMARCLSSLVASNVLEVQFVTPTFGNGIFHDKVGVFRDAEDNGVSFVGSANETGSAWSGLANHEQFEVFTTWSSRDSKSRFNRHVSDFEETWDDLRRGLRIVPAAEASALIQSSCPPEPLSEILQEVKMARSGLRPRPIAKRPLRSYQTEVLKDWRRNNHKGIISFATGGGKTLTAIEAIRNWTSDNRPALVLVPSKLLHRQWSEELRRELGHDVPILSVGASHPKSRWLDLLGTFTSSEPDFGPRIVVSTYDSVGTSDFIRRVNGGPHLLVVADEVHNAGAPQNRIMLKQLHSGAQLGLSATADRAGDDEGTLALRAYFGTTLQPEFTIVDAISEKILVPYDYSFETCQLNDQETEDWSGLTRRIGQDIVRNKGQISERGFILLQQRARIAKSAASKAALASRIMQDNYQEGDRWLVYCADYQHLKSVRESFMNSPAPLLEYHSRNEDHHGEVLRYFTETGGVLLAIKCLDEGVDIPAVSKAIILASSTNPREYIQRRGRVLRKSPGKYSASIFDTILVDQSGAALSTTELKRAKEFAEHSRNLIALAHLDDLLALTVESQRLDTIDMEFETISATGETNE